MKLVLQYLVAGVVFVVAVRQLIQLARHPEDRALRVLAPGFVAMSIAKFQINGSPVQEFAKGVLGPLYPGFVNSLWVAIAYCFATFFLMARDDIPAANKVKSARRALVLVTVVMMIAVLLPVVHPAGFRGYDYRSWERISYSVLYEGLAAVFFCLGIARAGRYIRHVGHVWLRWSLRFVCAGAAGMALVDVAALVTLAVRFVQDVDYPRHYPPLSAIYITGLLGGQAALALGLVLPAVGAAAGILRRRYDRIVARRLDAQIQPLWRVLPNAFPYVVLPGYRSAGTERPGGSAERRIAEVADGLAQLAPTTAMRASLRIRPTPASKTLLRRLGSSPGRCGYTPPGTSGRTRRTRGLSRTTRRGVIGRDGSAEQRARWSASGATGSRR